MAVKEKSGFFSIGYIENASSYVSEIRELCGQLINYAVLDRYVDEQWKDRRCLYWNQKFESVSPESLDIAYVMIDTGFCTSDDRSKIYGGFTAGNPGCGLAQEANWKGVLIGTKDKVLTAWKKNTNSLDKYTSIRDYQNTARVLNFMTGKSKSTADWAKDLQDAFYSARQNGRLGVYAAEGKPSISYFPLGEKDTSDEEIWLVMDENIYPAGGRLWFGLIAKSEGDFLDQILDMHCYHLGDMLFDTVSDAGSFLERLAQMAIEETWTASIEKNRTYGILRSYITHTLYRLRDEDRLAPAGTPRKVDEVNGRIYFNSGLLSRLFRQIIIVGDKKELKIDIPAFGVHTYDMICSVAPYSENDREIAKIYDGTTYKIPGIAQYFKEKTEVIFDAEIAIRLNDMHIFEDGVERKRLPKYDVEYQECKNNQAAKDALLARIARDFDSAILRARLMAERNYKLAVPQFWRETGEIQFLLPIYLGEMEEADKPQCALALALDRSGRVPYYRGATILTLDMAYNNARLIAKPDVFWLNSSAK